MTKTTQRLGAALVVCVATGCGADDAAETTGTSAGGAGTATSTAGVGGATQEMVLVSFVNTFRNPA